MFLSPPSKFSDLKYRSKYERHKIQFKTQHDGQRKLFMGSMNFLTLYPKTELVIYAGSAPGIPNKFFTLLFPEMKFIFIDPRPMSITYNKGPQLKKNYEIKIDSNKMTVDYCVELFKTYNFIVIEGFFTIDMAKECNKFNQHYNTCFWSDIRTTSEATDQPEDENILNDSIKQAIWIYYMKPYASMLKYRCPFMNEKDVNEAEAFQDERKLFNEIFKIDLYKEFQDGKFYYFKGDAWLQPWSGSVSTETRLIFKGVPEITLWDKSEWEDRMFYFNLVERVKLFVVNELDLEHGIDHCWNCARESQIWKKYIDNGNTKFSVIQLMKMLTYYIGKNRTLKTDRHPGNMY